MTCPGPSLPSPPLFSPSLALFQTRGPPHDTTFYLEGSSPGTTRFLLSFPLCGPSGGT